MSVVEADLDDDGSLSEEVYLDALVQRVTPAVSLFNNVRRLQIFKGFLIFATLNDADGNCDNERTSTRSLRHCHVEAVEGFITYDNQEHYARVASFVIHTTIKRWGWLGRFRHRTGGGGARRPNTKGKDDQEDHIAHADVFICG